MARLDDAGVDGADRDLVDLAAIHAEELAVRGRVAAVRRTGLSHGCPPGVRPCCSQTSRSNRCACGWVCRERRIAAGERRAAPDGERVVGVEGQHGDEACARPPARRTRRTGGAPRSNSAAVARTNSAAGQLRHVRPGDAGGVGQQGKWGGGAHGVGKSWATAAVQASRRSSGWQARAKGTGPAGASGGRITPAVSANRLPFAFVAGARAAVHDRQRPPASARRTPTAGSPETSRWRRRGRSERGAHDQQFAEKRPERRAGRDREHARRQKSPPNAA